jgi:hypothetical protein
VAGGGKNDVDDIIETYARMSAIWYCNNDEGHTTATWHCSTSNIQTTGTTTSSSSAIDAI